MRKNSQATLILAAGKSSRLSQLAFDRPKTLLSVNGQSLLSRLCRLFGPISEHLVVVGGRNAPSIRDHLAGELLSLHLIDDPEATELGSADSLRRGLKYLLDSGFDGNVVILESDVIISQEVFDLFNGSSARCKFITIQGQVSPSDDKVYSLHGSIGVAKDVPARASILGKFLGVSSFAPNQWKALSSSLTGRSGDYAQYLEGTFFQDAAILEISPALV